MTHQRRRQTTIPALFGSRRLHISRRFSQFGDFSAAGTRRSRRRVVRSDEQIACQRATAHHTDMANTRVPPRKHRDLSASRRCRRWRAHCQQRDMSQKTVQLLIGRLLTDEDLRLRFVEGSLETLIELRDQGLELTTDEIDALVRIDREAWRSMAARIHPRLQRCSLQSS
jgi:hypothetical protein